MALRNLRFYFIVNARKILILTGFLKCIFSPENAINRGVFAKNALFATRVYRVCVKRDWAQGALQANVYCKFTTRGPFEAKTTSVAQKGWKGSGAVVQES